MQSILLVLVLVSTCLACSRELPPSPNLSADNAPDKDFQYRELSEKNISNNIWSGCSCLYGKWTLNSIAKTGVSNQSEEFIEQQLGKKLYLGEELFMISFLEETFLLHSPEYNLSSTTIDSSSPPNGKTFEAGYRKERSHFHSLLVEGTDQYRNDKSVFFEIINCNELVISLDGRMYFFNKTENIPSKE